MKVSELIEKLNSLILEHGDIEVFSEIEDNEMGATFSEPIPYAEEIGATYYGKTNFELERSGKRDRRKVITL